MKKSTCNNLGGVCDLILVGETAEEMGENSKKHVIEMVTAGDVPHRKAMEEMMTLSAEDRQKWYKEFQDSFNSLEEA